MSVELTAETVASWRADAMRGTTYTGTEPGRETGYDRIRMLCDELERTRAELARLAPLIEHARANEWDAHSRFGHKCAWCGGFMREDYGYTTAGHIHGCKWVAAFGNEKTKMRESSGGGL